MDPEDIGKIAFIVQGGHFEYIRVTFRFKNAPSKFQRVMDNVIKESQGTVCLVFLNDIIVYSKSLQEHIVNLNKVFLALRESNLKIQMDKSDFYAKKQNF
jgi:hypothetical protein